MSDILSYTLSLQDQISAKLQKIGASSENALDKFSRLQTQAVKTSQLMKDMGGSVGALRDKLNLLKSEKEWIPSSNLTSIRKYNSEIKKLEKQIQRLDTINGSAFKTNLKGAIDNLPFSNLITNPVAQAGVALFEAGKMAMNFDEGIAKINTTAQLTPKELKSLKSELIGMGAKVGADLSTVPAAYEKILSQTNDVKLSTDILQQSLKGAKAGFADQTVVADALAQTLSVVGKENTIAQEVLDTLFAAKRVGAGEFADFARYVPGLVAGGSALGLGFKESAGMFAYMTAKGQSAEQSTMLLQNAYTALGKSDITKGLENANISVFNVDGSMKDMDVIFGQLQKKLQGFGKDDKAKSSFLEKIGLKDAQAKQAFMVLSSDSKKLSEIMHDVANARGESDAAFKNSENPIQKIALLWSKIQQLMISFGGIISTILVPALMGALFVLTPIFDTLTWLFDKISEGNPWVLGFAGVIALLTIAYEANTIALKASELWTKRKMIADKAAAFWAGGMIAVTNLWTAAQWAFNAAMAVNPVVWIVMAVIALIAAIAYVIYKTDGWGKQWDSVMNFMKYSFQAFVEAVKFYFSTWVNGFMMGLDIIKLGWYKFKEACGIGDSSENKSAIQKINADIEARQKAIVDGAKKVIDLQKKANDSLKWELSWNSDRKVSDMFGGASEQTSSAISPYVAANAAPTNKVAGNWAENNNPFAQGLSDKITPAALPGTDPAAKQKEPDNKDKAKKTTEAISSGGTRNTSINITLKNLVENIIFQGGLKENKTDMEKQVSEAMLRILNMVHSTA